MVDFAGQRNSRGTVALTAAAGKKKLRGRVGAFLQRCRQAVKVVRAASAASLALKDPGLRGNMDGNVVIGWEH